MHSNPSVSKKRSTILNLPELVMLEEENSIRSPTLAPSLVNEYTPFGMVFLIQ